MLKQPGLPAGTDAGVCSAMTSEWKTNNHKDAVNLTADHIDRLYSHYSTFDITRY
ncbi:hypothetical protein [Corallococcus sp. AB049A]|uniref:hypothetical protein n=1 Tax=Corallococcus sp. AB049A TaxID=2316721 RepID=UPI0013151B27|nr:hypothetical protein [Corallococcus sp. AB049A]